MIGRWRARGGQRAVDVVICVHDALDETRACIDSVIRTREAPGRLILVDDGSGLETRTYLESVRDSAPLTTLLRHEKALGYTRAANRGLAESDAPFVLLLNSDTVLTRGAIGRMLACMRSRRRVGLVGPLSNAASYQSVPEVHDSAGGWMVNTLPQGWQPDDAARLVASAFRERYLRVPVLNGFCTLYRRELLDRIGPLDEALFPSGYGEENDFCIRATAAGYRLLVCCDAYVYHAKSRSFGHERRQELSRDGREKLLARHGERRVKRISRALEHHRGLAQVRAAMARLSESWPPAEARPRPSPPMRVLFLLPVKGFSGGAHSVVQEVSGMRSLGHQAQVAVPSKYRKSHERGYAGYPESLFHYYDDDQALGEYAATFHVCVATIYHTVKVLANLVRRHPHLIPAYYIQDYEPNFEPAGTALHEEAVRSYNLIPDIVAFSKTDWLRRTVAHRHSIHVQKVRPSIDHRKFYEDGTRQTTGPVIVCAMVRPATPRRNAGVTMRVLSRAARRFGDLIRIEVFGAEPNDARFRALPRDFAFINHGVIPHTEAAALLRRAHVFVDFSTYQAFGRTALEAMASGCTVVLTKEGGVDEFAVHQRNCLLVDPDDEDDMFGAVARLVESKELREAFRAEGLDTAARYSIEGAARSELEVFERALEATRSRRAVAGELSVPARLFRRS